MVNEVNLNKEVIRLSSFDLPDESMYKYEVSDSSNKELLSLLNDNQEEFDKLIEYFNKNEKDSSYIINIPFDDKIQRTNVHKFIAKYYNNFDSTTEAGGYIKCYPMKKIRNF